MCALCVCVLSYGRFFVTPWTAARQTSLPMEFFRQEYWSGLPFSTPGDLPGIEPTSLESKSPALAGRFFTTVQPHLARLFILFSIQCAFGYSLDISGALEGMEVRNGILHRHVWSSNSCIWKITVSWNFFFIKDVYVFVQFPNKSQCKSFFVCVCEGMRLILRGWK